MMIKRNLCMLLWLLTAMVCRGQVWQYVDPRIGSEGVGRTFPGPSMPFGMCKPGPDCTIKPNAGWAPMPEVVTGFSQTHVSGTGGGQKYGNILIQPFLGNQPSEQLRMSEDFSLGYYATTFENGIRTEITIEVVSDYEVRGFSRIRGGWNNGDAYTVYFCLMSDKPFSSAEDKGNATLRFSDTLLNIKVGISYVSTQQAKRNISSCDFDTQLNLLRDSWDKLLSRFDVKGTEVQKRMFYTALYHTLIMPVDKSGENPKWRETPYYDDYYAIWDTYRSSSPLITLLDSKREVDIVNSLLNIYKREGYMPDARSGDCNGRTQGGSNAEVMIADAFVKGLEGIDYEYALEAMLKDAEADPGADHEKHGRGGLREYTTLGYLPYGIDRAGTRTIEYAYNDYCIAEVAKGLGRQDVYAHYLKQSGNWRNLWRSDYEWDDVKGYIMPRDAQGRWLDSVPWGHSKVFHPTIPYTPVTKVAPWYLPWWSTFFYEALSAEYSLSIPHDVPGLIEACGGAETFRKRLDLFFDRKRYNVGNEPSFLTPCLYHWIGRPDLTSDRVRQIITENYNDTPDGLPGNDDSGSMSSWLAFHMLGLYPNAGQSYYLLHAPLLPAWTLQLDNGKTLRGTLKGKGTHFEKVTFNGKVLEDARIEHAELMQGGELVFYVSAQKQVTKKKESAPGGLWVLPGRTKRPLGADYPSPCVQTRIAFTLNKQHRTWPLTFAWDADTLHVTCKEATYRIPKSVVEGGTQFCWDIPADGAVYQPQGTFAFVSRKAMRDLQEKGYFVYDGITWRLVSQGETTLVRADIDRTEMVIAYAKEPGLYLVIEMRHNPLGIDWQIAADGAF